MKEVKNYTLGILVDEKLILTMNSCENLNHGDKLLLALETLTNMLKQDMSECGLNDIEEMMKRWKQ